MRHHEQQKCNAFLYTASTHATVQVAMLEACVRAQLTIAVITESMWNDINMEVFLFVNIGAVLYFWYFFMSNNPKRKQTSYTAQFKLKVVNYAEENSNRNFVLIF